MSDNLLNDIKSSIEAMQGQMQDTYQKLAEMQIDGKSHDGTVVFKISGTYELMDVDIKPEALAGGISEFKWRIHEAWKDATAKIQQATQSKTMDLLQNMQIPDEIKGITGSDDGA